MKLNGFEKISYPAWVMAFGFGGPVVGIYFTLGILFLGALLLMARKRWSPK